MMPKNSMLTFLLLSSDKFKVKIYETPENVRKPLVF